VGSFFDQNAVRPWIFLGDAIGSFAESGTTGPTGTTGIQPGTDVRPAATAFFEPECLSHGAEAETTRRRRHVAAPHVLAQTRIKIKLFRLRFVAVTRLSTVICGELTFAIRGDLCGAWHQSLVFRH
jgi:hypothetical protein